MTEGSSCFKFSVGDECERDIDGQLFAAKVTEIYYPYFSVRYLDDNKEEVGLQEDDVRFPFVESCPDYESVCLSDTPSSPHNNEYAAVCQSVAECAQLRSPILEYIPIEENHVISCTDFLADFSIASDRVFGSTKHCSTLGSAVKPEFPIDYCSAHTFNDEITTTSSYAQSKSLKSLCLFRCGLIFSCTELQRYTTDEYKAKQETDPFAQLDLKPLAALCASCESLTIFRCGGCSWAYYCSRKCQRRHWAHHKVYCMKQDDVRDYSVEPLFKIDKHIQAELAQFYRARQTAIKKKNEPAKSPRKKQYPAEVHPATHHSTHHSSNPSAGDDDMCSSNPWHMDDRDFEAFNITVDRVGTLPPSALHTTSPIPGNYRKLFDCSTSNSMSNSVGGDVNARYKGGVSSGTLIDSFAGDAANGSMGRYGAERLSVQGVTDAAVSSISRGTTNGPDQWDWQREEGRPVAAKATFTDAALVRHDSSSSLVTQNNVMSRGNSPIVTEADYGDHGWSSDEDLETGTHRVVPVVNHDVFEEFREKREARCVTPPLHNRHTPSRNSYTQHTDLSSMDVQDIHARFPMCTALGDGYTSLNDIDEDEVPPLLPLDSSMLSNSRARLHPVERRVVDLDLFESTLRRLVDEMGLPELLVRQGLEKFDTDHVDEAVDWVFSNMDFD